MGLLDRRRFVFGLALILCLALVGRWVLLSTDSVKAPARAEEITTIDGLPGRTQAPAIAETGTDAVPSTGNSPSAFGTFRGRIIDAATREPVREFEVRFRAIGASQAANRAPNARAFRTVDGRFAWQDLPPGKWTVSASARGYQSFDLLALQVSQGDATPELVLPLRPGHTLRGRVYDEVSGAGIASASINFREPDVGRLDANRMRVPVISAQNGSFVLEAVPPGRVTLDISAQDHADRELGAFVGDDTPPLEIGLSAGGTIAGHLTAADGLTGVVGNVYLGKHDEQSGVGGPTGKAGEFSFPHVAPGRYQLRGYARGIAVIEEIVLASNQRIEGVVLALRDGRGIRGVITGLRPEELQQAYISLSRERGAGPSYANSGVDERGAYALKGVQPGRVQLIAHAMRRHLSKTVDVPADADLTVDLHFPPGARLSGRVTRAGKPLPGVGVNAQPLVPQRVYVNGTSTSKEGAYAIEDLAPGEYSVSADGYRSQPVRVAGDTVFDLDVPLPHLSGQVLENESNVPIVGADVQVWPAEPGSPRIRLQRLSDHFGQFALVGLEPGDFLLTAYKSGYEMFRQRISYASPVADMTIRLHRDRGVEIRVRDAGSGLALRQVYAIELTSDGDDNWLYFQLDENGVGYIPGGLAGGTLSFYSSGYVPAVIGEWNGQRLDLQLERRDPT